jgi:formate/nitrite transporter FocA (FNT family)
MSEAPGRTTEDDNEILNSGEKEQAAAFSAPRALVIHEIIRDDGERELGRTTSALALSGLAAGLSMGFSFLTEALLRATMPDAPWRHAVESLGYSIGFIIVVLGRQQLFTESTLTAVLPVVTRQTMKALLAAARLWAIVLTVNIIGTWIFAALLVPPQIFSPEVHKALGALGLEAIHHHFGPTVLKAVFAGWLIALMVWLLPSGRSARLWIILIITYVVALGRLSHIIAGSGEGAYAVLTGLAPFKDYVVGFFLPTVIGNIFGGVALVTLLNHGSIAAEIEGSSEGKLE